VFGFELKSPSSFFAVSSRITDKKRFGGVVVSGGVSSGGGLELTSSSNEGSFSLSLVYVVELAIDLGHGGDLKATSVLGGRLITRRMDFKVQF
jgi:hypothetical protein